MGLIDADSKHSMMRETIGAAGHSPPSWSSVPPVRNSFAAGWHALTTGRAWLVVCSTYHAHRYASGVPPLPANTVGGLLHCETTQLVNASTPKCRRTSLQMSRFHRGDEPRSGKTAASDVTLAPPSDASPSDTIGDNIRTIIAVLVESGVGWDGEDASGDPQQINVARLPAPDDARPN